MKLRYWHPLTGPGNFGDELNVSLFNRLFGSVFEMEEYRDVDFYGIGTIIRPEVGQQNKCAIFGSGVWEVAPCYNKKNWNVFFLRGPVSSNILGYGGEKFITDAAYSILLLDDMIPPHSKKHAVSVIPHMLQMPLVDWKQVSEQTGVNIIDPYESVDFIMDEIVSSEKIISAAMHGAIIADICRVPWARLKMELLTLDETFFINELKWRDWLHSMNLSEKSIAVWNTHAQFQHKKNGYIYDIVNALQRELKDGYAFQLSSDIILGNKINCIANEVDRFLNHYK